MPILTRSARRNSQTASEGVGVPQPDHEQELPPVAGQTELGGGRGKRGGRRGGRGHTGEQGQGGRRGGHKGGHAGTIGRQTNHQNDDFDNVSFIDDPGHDEKLQARNGCLGTVSSRGWEAKTNFLIDVYGLINSSSEYKLKGMLGKHFLRSLNVSFLIC